MPKFSDTATSILTLLNNANELIVRSSDRKNADAVMRATRVYAKGKNFTMPQDKLDNFSAILIDARPYTLTMLIKDIANDVMSFDVKNTHANNKRVQLKEKNLKTSS